MMKLIACSIVFLLSIHFVHSQDLVPLSIGEVHTFHSEILDEDRILNIYLPLSYHPDSSHTYPVIYLLDGSIDEDFIHIAGLVQFSSFSWIDRIPESIVIGIANVNRQRDFTFPISDAKETWDLPKGFDLNRVNFESAGGSVKFIDFIEKELQPYIDQQYRTNSKKALLGQSLGGLLATEILLTRPQLFTDYLIISPSLWWDGQSLLEKEKSVYQNDLNIYIAVGNEGNVMVKDAKRLYKLLQSNSADKTSVYFKFHKECDHGDVLHEAVYEAFKKPLLR